MVCRMDDGKNLILLRTAIFLLKDFNVSSAALLTLDIDSHLSFSQHVDKICKKLSQRIALLRKDCYIIIR